MNKVLLLACSLLLALSACQPAAPPIKGAPGIGDPYYPDLGNGGYDVQQYTIALKVDPDANTVQGSTSIELQPTETLSSFDLDFAGLTIDSVTVDGSSAEYKRSAGELIIVPASPLTLGGKSIAVVAYHGTPETVPGLAQVGPAGIGWLHAHNGAINVISEPDGAATWFPSNNHPRDKALYRYEITVPKTWIVAANGALEAATDEGGQTKFTWVMDKPMATYLSTVNIDHYTLKTLQGPHGIRVQNYFPPDYPPERIRNFDKLPDMMAFLEGFYGPYPFQEYGVVVANPENPLCMGGGTAMENQTLSVHCPSSSMAGEEVLVHELSHQWFGDSVSIENWKDIWLKEGLATYSQWLWAARDGAPDLLDRMVKAERKGYHPSVPISDPLADSLYRSETYTGGAIAIYALKQKVGDETFSKIIQTYLDRYKYRNAGTDEFIQVAEEVGGQDLKAFFDSWLFTTDIPALQ